MEPGCLPGPPPSEAEDLWLQQLSSPSAPADSWMTFFPLVASLLLFVTSFLLVVAMPGAASSFLLLVVRPQAPSSVLATGCRPLSDWL